MNRLFELARLEAVLLATVWPCRAENLAGVGGISPMRFGTSGRSRLSAAQISMLNAPYYVTIPYVLKLFQIDAFFG